MILTVQDEVTKDSSRPLHSHSIAFNWDTSWPDLLVGFFQILQAYGFVFNFTPEEAAECLEDYAHLDDPIRGDD